MSRPINFLRSLLNFLFSWRPPFPQNDLTLKDSLKHTMSGCWFNRCKRCVDPLLPIKAMKNGFEHLMWTLGGIFPYRCEDSIIFFSRHQKFYPPISYYDKFMKLLYLQRTYRRKTKATDFILTVSEQARKKNISQSQINKWKESLPHELVIAINQGTFTGSILSYGLLYPEYWSDSIDLSNTRAKKKWKNMTRILTIILDQSKQRGVETAVVLIPSPFQYDPKINNETNPWVVAGSEIRKEWLSEGTEIQRKMRLWSLSEGVSFLDLTPVFREAIKSNRNLNWELDGHWNHLGHQVAANAIASWLDDQQVFSFIKSKRLTNH